MENKTNVIAMGGSFNPPTIAHLKLMRAAMDALDAEAGYLVPVSHAYLKRKMARVGCGHLCIPTETRLKMLEVMIAEEPRLRIDTEEINEPFAVTSRTMEQIQKKHPNARIWFVAGEDKLDMLVSFTQKWNFLPRFGAVMFARGGDLERQIAENAELAPFREAIAVVAPPPGIEGISSTAVRERLFSPDAVASMLHPGVLPLVRRLRPEDFPEEIIFFKDEYAFLGNGYPAPVRYEETLYPSAEAAFQASKTTDPAEKSWFARPGQENVKQKGGRLQPRPGWEEEKDAIMRCIVEQKFLQNPQLLQKLLSTGNRRLINGGKGKKDTCWGVNLTTWEGENRLGKILEELRARWKEEAGDEVHQSVHSEPV